MTSVQSIALGGMQSQQRGVEVAAQNVANVNTDGYRAQRYDAGTDSTKPRYGSPIEQVSFGDEDAPPSDVDLATEFVDMKRYEIGYSANAKVVKVADSMTGTLLDMVG